MIDFCTSEPHFADHLLGIWRALPSERRGRWYAPPKVVPHVKAMGIEVAGPQPTLGDITTVVASSTDLFLASDMGRRIVYCEHGAGQSYIGRLNNSNSYAGSATRPGVHAMLVPGPHPAARNREIHRTMPIFQIGDPLVERLRGDLYAQNLIVEGTYGPSGITRRPATVAISFHWPCSVCLETMWVRDEYAAAVRALVQSGEFLVIGHGHPKARVELERWWGKMGVEWVPSFAEVCARADLYVIDNSSTLFEFPAITGKPVVAMNGRNYRRNVHHGLRFWDAVPGLQVDRPEDLAEVIRRALADPPEVQEARAVALGKVYSWPEGGTCALAAKIVLEVDRGMIRDSGAQAWPEGAIILRALTLLNGMETGARTTIKDGEEFAAAYEMHRDRNGRLFAGRPIHGANPQQRADGLVKAGMAVILRTAPPLAEVVVPGSVATVGVVVTRNGQEVATKMIEPVVSAGKAPITPEGPLIPLTPGLSPETAPTAPPPGTMVPSTDVLGVALPVNPAQLAPEEGAIQVAHGHMVGFVCNAPECRDASGNPAKFVSAASLKGHNTRKHGIAK